MDNGRKSLYAQSKQIKGAGWVRANEPEKSPIASAKEEPKAIVSENKKGADSQTRPATESKPSAAKSEATKVPSAISMGTIPVKPVAPATKGEAAASKTQSAHSAEPEVCGFCIGIGMAYVPQQKWQKLYEPAVGFERGTIFEQLDFPFLGREVLS